MTEKKQEKQKKVRNKEFSKEIEIPESVQAEIKGGVIIIKKEDNELKRKYAGFSIKKEDKKLVLYDKKATKRERKMIMTTLAHIKNMIKGLEEGFEYKLEICSVHFPMNVEYNKDKNEFIIENFLGETKPRVIKLPENVEVKIDSNIITINSHDKEAAGLAAAVIERLSKVKGKDRRIFQDGIYIISKSGKVI